MSAAALVTAIVAGVATLANLAERLVRRRRARLEREHAETEQHEDAEFRRITGGYGGLLERLEAEVGRLQKSRDDCRDEVHELRGRLNAALGRIFELEQAIAQLQRGIAKEGATP